MRRFEVLDSWRGVCALFVAIHHFPQIFYFADSALIRSSWRFVDFFFVLSGFVITHGYADKISSGFALRKFVIRRFLRLYPLQLFTFAVFASWILFFDTSRVMLAKQIGGFHLTNLFGEFTPERVIAHLTLLQGFLGDPESAGFNTPSWSISVEFWTYIVFAAICLCLPRRLMIVQAILAAAALWILYSGDQSKWYMNFVRSLAGFSLGSICYLLVRGMTPTISRFTMTILEAVAIVGALCLLCLAPQLGLLSPLVFAPLVAIFSFQAGAISDVLKYRPLKRAGLYSYSIYMNHAFLIGLIKIGIDALNRVSSFDIASHPSISSAIVFAFLCVLWRISQLTYQLIEIPGQKLSFAQAKLAAR